MSETDVFERGDNALRCIEDAEIANGRGLDLRVDPDRAVQRGGGVVSFDPLSLIVVRSVLARLHVSEPVMGAVAPKA